jgi:hypothetical protein
MFCGAPDCLKCWHAWSFNDGSPIASRRQGQGTPSKSATDP